MNHCHFGYITKIDKENTDMTSRWPLLLVMDSLSALLHMGPSSVKAHGLELYQLPLFWVKPCGLEFYLPTFLSRDNWTYYCRAQILFYYFIIILLLFFGCFDYNSVNSLNPNTSRTVLNMQLVA
jgi:hypothetical protein